jgi:flagellar basal-body rod protein FlgB
MNVTGFQVDVLARLLDVATLRHTVIAENVANVNTPGYRRLDVSFDEAFSRTLAAGRDGRALQITPKVVEAKGGTERPDGSNVDVDSEMGGLTKNQTLYSAYAQILALQLAEMRSAISGQ